MNKQQMTHKRVLVSATLILAALVAWLSVIEPAGAGPRARSQAELSDILPPSDTILHLDFADPNVRNEWVTSPASQSWRFSGDEYEQADADARNAGSYFSRMVEDDYRFTVDVRRSGGTGSYGITFNIDPNAKQPTYLVRFNDVANELQWGHFDADGEFLHQGVFPAPPGNPDSYRTIAVDVAGNSYTALLIDKESGTVVFESPPVPFQRLYPSHFGLHTNEVSALFSTAKVRVGLRPTPTPSPVATDTQVVPTVSTATHTATPPPVNTATATATETATIVGTPEPLLEPSDTVYDLALDNADSINAEWRELFGEWAVDSEGRGYRYDDINRSNGISYYLSRPNGDYEITVELKMEERGSASYAGVVFNAPRRSSLNDTYIVRFNGDRTLEWGLFTDNEFKKTAGLDLSDEFLQTDDADVHRIRVTVTSDHYTVAFNDRLVEDANAVQFEDPHIRVEHPYFGLYSSETKVLFSAASIDVDNRTTPTATPTLQPTPSPTSTPNCSDEAMQAGTYELLTIDQWHRISDGWLQAPSNNSMRHGRIDVANAVTYYGGCVGGDYVIDVDLLVNAVGDPPWGAGIVFNAPDRANTAGAYVVRFDDDHLLEWGTIGDENQFQHQGDAVLSEGPLAPGEHHLTVSVSSDRYFIRFDGVAVSETEAGIPFNDLGTGRVGQPYVGLYATNADARFQDMLLEIKDQFVGATLTPSATPTLTWTPTSTATNTRVPTTRPTSTQTITRTPTRTPTITPAPTGTATSVTTSPLATPTVAVIFTSPTSNVLPAAAQPPTPNTVATSTAAALATQQALPTETPSPTLTWTPTVVPTPLPPVAEKQAATAPEPAETETPEPPAAQIALVVTATFTPTQRPIETPTPTSTPDTLLLFAGVLDSALAAAGWIWFAAGSLVFFIVAGILAGLGFRQQERNRYELLAPVEPTSPLAEESILDEEMLAAPGTPEQRQEYEPPNDWPPSLP